MSRTYRHLPELNISRDRHSLSCIQDADIELVRQWRNAQMEVLRQAAPISAQQQQDYFSSAIWPEMALKKPGTILMSLIRGSDLIGYGGLVHCSWPDRRAEISILCAPQIVADEAAYRAALLAFLAMIRELAFTRLELNRLTTETYDIRPFHIGVLEEAGMRREGRLREHVLMHGRAVDSLIHGWLARD